MKEWVIKKRLNQLSENGKLTAESNTILLKEYHNDKCAGIPKEESEARTILILGNLQLVAYILAKKLNMPNFNRDSDEYSIGKLGLIKAIDNFNINKDVTFSTYATRVILNEIYMHHRRENNKSHGGDYAKMSLDECMMEKFRGEPKLQYFHNFSVTDDFVEMAALKDLFERAKRYFDYLLPIEREYITLYFGLDDDQSKAQEEVAALVGKSRSQVSKVIKRGLEKLYVLLKNPDELSPEQLYTRNRLLYNKENATNETCETFTT